MSSYDQNHTEFCPITYRLHLMQTFVGKNGLKLTISKLFFLFDEGLMPLNRNIVLYVVKRMWTKVDIF